MEKIHLYLDFLSQPSRAVLIFCLVNNIDVEIHRLNLAKGEHKSPQFKSINPMGQVPAIVDGRLKLSESHTIMRYLSRAFPGVPDHWYPVDATRRAYIDNVLDWHHANLRRGSAGLVMQRVVAPAFGLPSDDKAAFDAQKLLKTSLSNLEKIWLKGNGRFLANGSQPSIADLSLACEVMQLQLLGASAASELLGPLEKVKKWIDAVEKATAPHFSEVHAQFLKDFKRTQERRNEEPKSIDSLTDLSKNKSTVVSRL